MPTGIYPRPEIEERLGQRLQAQGDCWIFIGDEGEVYGRIRFDGGRQMKAHRAAWVLAGKPLAKHKRLHHTCENKRCCNPSHLRLTTKKGHMHFHRWTKCSKGHDLVGENVVLKRDGSRKCRRCWNAYMAAYRGLQRGEQ